MDRFPSRTYITQRTRMLRRIYYVAGAVAVVAVVVILLYSISDRTPEQQLPQVAAKAQAKDSPAAPEQPVEEPAHEEPSAPAPETAPKLELPLAVTTEADQTSQQSYPEVAKTIDEAMALVQSEPLKAIQARTMLNELLGKPMSAQQRSAVKDKLSALSQKWLFSKDAYPGDELCSLYKVKLGDQLSEIGRAHNVPWQIIQQINEIPRPEALQAGKTIKVIKGPFHARVHRSTFTMDLYLQDTYVRSFPVGLGKPGNETPTGLWLVKTGGKVVKPIWTDRETGKTYEPDDPDYPLGSRWISLEGLSGQAKGRDGFGIHGTKDPSQIGTGESRGCIRLHNGDVILVYNLLMPGMSRVEVVD